MPMYTECIVPDGGYKQLDGYLRVLDRPRKSGGRLVMLHRLEYEKVHGSIPDGYTVNHLCKNRCCSNVNHMELLTRTEHVTKDNAQRYKPREDSIVAEYLKNPAVTQTELGIKYGLGQAAVSKILQRRITND